MINYLLTDSQMREARELLTESGLDFDLEFDVFIGIYDGGGLKAVGARHKNILKMVAVSPEYQDTGMFAEIMDALVSDAYRSGYEHLFVFTKPMYSMSFQYLNFKPLITTDSVALLEFGRSINDYMKQWSPMKKSGRTSAVVMNCNPFTFGHRFLAERASAESDNVFIFVVEEDSSLLPFSARMELVRLGTADLGNVTVLPTGPYAVSRITFPSYFLKDKTKVTYEQLKIDLSIFGGYTAMALNITRRYAGQEPVCELTRMYNDAMRSILPQYGVEFVEIERKSVNGHIISASSVREMLLGGDLEGVREMVPDATYKYLTENRGKLISKNSTPVLNS